MQDNDPWSFDNDILVLCQREKGMTAQNVSFTHIPLWVQVWGLLFDILTEAVAWYISDGLGTMIALDNKAFDSDKARFLCI